MIDIHSHILYGVDDGSSSAEETKAMLDIAVSEGISCIIATPHYILGNNDYDRQSLLSRYEDVKKLIAHHHMPIELKLGNELFVDFMLPQKLSKKECFSLADSHYVLVEFSHMTKRTTVENLVYELKLQNYIPVIAHPERSFDMDEDMDLLLELIEQGCYLQSNTGSLIGVYGKEVKKMVYELLDRQMISFLSTDAHTTKRRAPRVREAYDIVREKYGNEYADKLFSENAKKLLCDEYIQPAEVRAAVKNNFVEKIKYIFTR